MKSIEGALARIADAVSSGQSPAARDLDLLKENAFELSVGNSEFWTHVLPKDGWSLKLPHFDHDWSDLEDAISEERLEEFNAGAAPRQKELDLSS